MRTLPFLLLAALALPLACAPAAAAGGSGDYTVRFECPKTVVSDAASSAPTACPAYVLDAEDVMAQPVLAVDPRDPGLVAFNALHGGPGLRAPGQDPAPTEGSRDDVVHQPHTTFVSTDGGAGWSDNRYHSPLPSPEPEPSPIPLLPPTQSPRQVFGEDNAMASDGQGRLTIASLYSHRDGQGGPVRFSVVVWGMGRIGTALDYSRGYVVVRPADPDAAVDSLHAVDLPGARQSVVAWRETGSDGKGWIQILHRDQADGGAQWTPLERAQRIGPCSAVTNPVAVDGRLYVGCFAADGYVGGVRGQLQIHAVDPATWTTARVGPAPLQGLDNAVLASAEALRPGGLAVAGAGVREGRAVALLAFGVRGEAWTRAHDYAPQLTDPAGHPGGQLREARVNALAFRASSGTAHLVYMERYQSSSAAAGAQEFGKSYAVVQADGRFLGRFSLGYGDPQSRATVSPQVAGLGGAAFDDRHDSIVVQADRTGRERTFLAFGDYGAVRFAEVREEQPPPPVFPPIGAPAALPTLASTTSPVLVGALAATLSTAAVLRAALAKSKKAAEAPTL